MKYRNIERLREVVAKAITRTDSTLDYARTVQAIERLANVVRDTETDTDVWYLGEFCCPLDSILVGAYWHLTEWHGGQWSDTYRAMCAVGDVYSPGMESGPEPESCENDVYEQLAMMAEGDVRC